MTLHIVFLQTVKKVESYEQINIQSVILPEAQCTEEEWTYPGMCRVTVNGKTSQFSCKLDVDEKIWSMDYQGRNQTMFPYNGGNNQVDKRQVYQKEI